MPTKSCITAALTILGFVHLPLMQAAEYRILPPPTEAYNTGSARAVSGDGSVVVADFILENFPYSPQSFLWSEEDGYTALADATGNRRMTIAYGISTDGRIVVGNGLIDSAYQAMFWTAENGIQPLVPAFPGPTGFESLGMSGDGNVVLGKFGGSNEQNAFRWTRDGGYVALDVSPGPLLRQTRAYDASTDGSVIVGRRGAGGGAFRWTEESGIVELGDLPGGQTCGSAEAISNDGQTIVGYGCTETGAKAMRWTAADGMIDLGDLPGSDIESQAYAVSGNGSVITGCGFTDFGYEAFVWQEATGMLSLRDMLMDDGVDLMGFIPEGGLEISADGRVIVGIATDLTDSLPFVATIEPVPEPSAIVLAAVAVVCGLGERARAQRRANRCV